MCQPPQITGKFGFISLTAFVIFKASLIGFPVKAVTPKQIEVFKYFLISSIGFSSILPSIIITSYFSLSNTEPIANKANGISKKTAFGLYNKTVFFKNNTIFISPKISNV